MEGRSITVGNTVVVKVVGAGVGKNKQTSGVWKYVMEFEPPVKNKNVRCFVKSKLPASGRLPAREVLCGYLKKYQRAENGKKVVGRTGCGTTSKRTTRWSRLPRWH